MIAACMIVKGNDWEQTKRCIESLDVDKVYITTTQVKNHPKHPLVEWSHFDWTDNFSEARNFNFSQASEDYLLWIDSDDIYEGESPRDVAASMKKIGLDAVFADYNYEIDPETKEVIIVHPRERIVRNGVYEWKGALHETLIPKLTPKTQYVKDFVINHYPTDREENGQRNIRILMADYDRMRQEVREGKREEIDPRTEYYLARCLFDLHEHKAHRRASELFQDYLEHSGWDEERMQAWIYLGNIFFLSRNYDDAIEAYIRAIKERPEYPTPYINLGRAYAAKKDFDRAEFYVKQGLSIEQPNTALVITPRDDKVNALTTLYMVNFARRDMKKCLRLSEKIYDILPTKDNKSKIEAVEELVKMSDQLKAVGTMVEDMKEDEVLGLLEALPANLKDTIFVTKLRNAYTRPKKWSDKSIVYYAASDIEPWSPKSLETGIGGSEEAIIYLSKHWAKLGYEVTVYANVGDAEGEYDGVQYLNYYRFNHKDDFNILIGWRNPLFFKYSNFSARMTLLDLHDVPMEGEYVDEIVNKIDYIMVKSPYHRSLLPNIPDDKFKIINNGIELPKVKSKKSRYKVFYGSSYDRGLETLLKMWADIVKAEPLAELHVCYGWELHDKVWEGNPHKAKWKKYMNQMMSQPGVVHHGRVGKDELYKIAKSCGVWAYPTNFEEISCITAMYCMDLGTVPVVYDYAALQTTVTDGIKIKPGDAETFKQKLIDQIKRPKTFKFNPPSWESMTSEWVKVFNTPHKQLKLSVYTPTIRKGWWNIMADTLSKQTHTNFEWIIVDDYKENRQSVADEYAKKYGLDIRYYHKPKRAVKRIYGLSSANNKALYEASGDVLVWLQDFIILPNDALERLNNFHRRYPNSLYAPVDEYRESRVKPNTDSEDWFNGETDVAGKFIRQNIRIGNEGLREVDNPYDFELNFGSAPVSLLRDIGGFWEFFDDGLGYDNTEIAMRAMEYGGKLFVDEHSRAICIDHWEPLKDNPEQLGENRTHNLNDPRFDFLVKHMKSGELDVVRDPKIDSKLRLDYKIPEELDQDQAVDWMKENISKIVDGWSL